jgi:uncharacterized protein YdcH (DUF465 family)
VASLGEQTDDEPTGDNHLNELRHKRVRLKDEIYAMPTAARP